MNQARHRGRFPSIAASIIELFSVFGMGAAAEENSWEQNTALVSREGQETVVASLKEGNVLFRNGDPQLAIEWAMAHASTTVVLAAAGDGVAGRHQGIMMLV